MVWSGASFGAKHNHSLTPDQAAHAARQANAIVRSGAPEGLAIAVANKHAKRADGGSAPVETTAMETPMYQSQVTNFQNQTPEQLQEAALKLKGSPAGQIAQRVLAQKRMGVTSPAQPGPQAGMPQSYALGGMLDPKGGVHFGERGITGMGTGSTPGGFLNTSGPGRSDNLQITPHADSYVLPADVVSGLGEGNSLAGAKALEQAFHTGPGGVPLPHFPNHLGHVSMPARAKGGGFDHGMPRAIGGATQDAAPRKTVPIVAAGGEYVVTPEQVAALGGGDIKRGHAILDAFVLHVRKRTVGEMKKLKGPVKS